MQEGSVLLDVAAVAMIRGSRCSRSWSRMEPNRRWWVAGVQAACFINTGLFQPQVGFPLIVSCWGGLRVSGLLSAWSICHRWFCVYTCVTQMRQMLVAGLLVEFSVLQETINIQIICQNIRTCNMLPVNVTSFFHFTRRTWCLISCLIAFSWRCWSLIKTLCDENICPLLTLPTGPDMYRSLLFTLLCGCATAVISLDLDRHWELWKKMHQKVYPHQVNPFYIYTSPFSSLENSHDNKRQHQLLHHLRVHALFPDWRVGSQADLGRELGNDKSPQPGNLAGPAHLWDGDEPPGRHGEEATAG